MVFKKKGRSNWYLWPTLPGFGRVGPWSTGTANERLAKGVEHFLQDLALTDPSAVRGIVEARYSLQDAYIAQREGRLAELKERSGDPPLNEVIRRFEAMVTDRRIQDGLEQLSALAPRGARMSWLTQPKNISDVCASAVAEGRKPNSVKRSLYRAIADLLGYEIGKARRATIMADVVKPGENDARDVTLTAEQAAELLEACDEEIRPIITVAILTGIDRGPLLRLTPAHVDVHAGTIKVPDRKSASRSRTLELSTAAQVILRQESAGKRADEAIWKISEHALGRRFRTARQAAGLEWLRIKDLRHVFATMWVSSGGGLKDLGGAMGHSISATTLKYTASQAREVRTQMDRVARALRLDRAHLTLEKDGTA
ncbi:MAG: site-specific integrase [Gemmatimonadetes bacterium]|nr:site-specific integrase [Gemmatimonadota bacterium]